MKKLLFLLLVVISYQCQPTYKQSQINYELINGNLYTDKKENLYIKTTDNTEDIHTKDVYISKMFVYGKEKSVLLKKVIDKNTYEQVGNSLYSKDKNNVYFLWEILEGGNFGIIQNAKPENFKLINIDDVQFGKSGNNYYLRGELIDIDSIGVIINQINIDQTKG